MTTINNFDMQQSRRRFLQTGAAGLGSVALTSMLSAEAATPAPNMMGGVLGDGHFKARAKRVIYLFMAGAPSQLDTFDYKPKMDEYYDKDLPESIRQGQRLTTMTAAQARFPIAPSLFKFKQYGPSIEQGEKEADEHRPCFSGIEAVKGEGDKWGGERDAT